MNLDLVSLLALQRLDVLGDVARDQDRVVPLDPVERRRGDVLAGAVEVVGDRSLVIGPVRGEDLVRTAAEQQLVGLGPGDPVDHLFVEIVDGPAALGEAAGRIFMWPAGRLHDPVERDERVDSEGSHRFSLVSWSSPPTTRRPEKLIARASAAGRTRRRTLSRRTR